MEVTFAFRLLLQFETFQMDACLEGIGRGWDLWPILQGETRVAKPKNAYNSLVTAASRLGRESNL